MPAAPASPPAAPAFEFRLGHLYLAVVLLLLFRIGLAWFRTHRLLRATTPGPSGARVSNRITVPVTIGLFRPVIILPASWTDWDNATLSAALTHEQTHARRRDPLILLVAAINKALFWFHPLAWWIERRLAALAEEVADEACLRKFGDRESYAAILLDMARVVSANRGRLAIAMARSSNVSRRIGRILSWNGTHGWSRRRTAALVALALPLTLAAAAFQAVPTQPPAANSGEATAAGPVVTIQGAVLDSSTSQPIEGARVIFNRSDRGRPNVSSSIWQTELSPADPDPVSDTLAVLTGSDGAFRFQIDSPARFRLFVDHEGYVNTPTGGDPRALAFETATGEAKDDIVVQLQPQGSISGRVFDMDTEQPVQGLAVVPFYMREERDSRAKWPTGTWATTDSEGRYQLDGLAPGEYYLRFRLPPQAKVEDPTSIEDFRDVEFTSYVPFWYPGMDAVEQAAPLILGSRGKLEGNDVWVSKRRTAGVRGRVVGDEAVGPVAVSLTEIERRTNGESYRGFARGERSVGSAFEIGKIHPGYYWLLAETVDEDAGEKLYASLTFEVGVENLDGMDLHLRPGLTVSGRMKIAGREENPDEPALPGEDTRVGLFPISRGSLDGDSPVPVRSEDGSFVIERVVPGELLVLVSRVPQGYKVAEVRYNNSVAEDHVISIEPDATEHHVDITLAPASGSLSVQVTDGLDPSPGATVLAVPMSVDASVPGNALNRVFLNQATADDQGRATVNPLLPGAYRVIAFPQGALWKNEIYRVFTSGQEVRVAATGTTLFQLRAED